MDVEIVRIEDSPQRRRIRRVGYHVSLGRVRSRGENGLVDVFEHLANLVKMECRSDEKVGLKIYLNELYPHHIEYNIPSKLDGEMIVNRIASLIQSNSNVNVSKIYVESTYFKISM